MDVFTGGGLLVLMVCGGFRAKSNEKKQWNNGKCSACGSPLENFDTDSQGGRGYSCSDRDCKSGSVWISYNVDKVQPA